MLSQAVVVKTENNTDCIGVADLEELKTRCLLLDEACSVTKFCNHDITTVGPAFVSSATGPIAPLAIAVESGISFPLGPVPWFGGGFPELGWERLGIQVWL